MLIQFWEIDTLQSLSTCLNENGFQVFPFLSITLDFTLTFAEVCMVTGRGLFVFAREGSLSGG